MGSNCSHRTDVTDISLSLRVDLGQNLQPKSAIASREFMMGMVCAREGVARQSEAKSIALVGHCLIMIALPRRLDFRSSGPVR